MSTIRGIPAILVILVLALLPIGSGVETFAVESSTSIAAGMADDQAMPECSSCRPGGAGKAICVQVCLGFFAILPDTLPRPREVLPSVRVALPADRLTGAKAAPEPRPPKAIIFD